MSKAGELRLLPSVQETVVEALRKLPRRADLSPEELERLVHRHAQAIIRAGQQSNKVVLLNDPETYRVVKADLIKLIRAARKMASETKALRSPKAGRKLFNAVLTESDLDPDEMDRRLQAIRELAEALTKDAERALADEDVLPKAGRGRPPKVRADFVASATAAAYRSLTGRRATRTANPIDDQNSGPFIALLNEMYGVLDIDASADAKTDRIRKQHKRMRKSE